MNFLKRYWTLVLVAFIIVGATILFLSTDRNAPPAEVYQVHAFLHSTSEGGAHILKDTDGNLWEVVNLDIPKNTELLLELNNNGTPYDFRDDEVIQVWQIINDYFEND